MYFAQQPLLHSTIRCSCSHWLFRKLLLKDADRRHRARRAIAGRYRFYKQDMLSAIEDKIERIKIMLHSFKPEALELRFRSIQQPLLLQFDDAKEEILNRMKDRLKDFRHRLDILTRTIEGADPQGILNRGYSIVRNKETGKTVRSFEEVSSGVLLTVRPAKGSFEARVEKPAR